MKLTMPVMRLQLRQRLPHLAFVLDELIVRSPILLLVTFVVTGWIECLVIPLDHGGCELFQLFQLAESLTTKGLAGSGLINDPTENVRHLNKRNQITIFSLNIMKSKMSNLTYTPSEISDTSSARA